MRDIDKNFVKRIENFPGEGTMNILVRCLLLLLIFSLPQVVCSAADGPDHWEVQGVKIGDVLNMRLQPDLKSQKVGEIPSDGKCLKNLKCAGGLTFEEFTSLSEAEKEKIKKDRPRWCQIEYKGQKGWVAGRYLREGFCDQKSD